MANKKAAGAAQKAVAPAQRPKHIEYLDLDKSGVKKEVLIVKRWADGAYTYIETAPLDMIDKSRLKTILSSPMADKFEAWELLAMTRLNNGMNGLDYFHQLAKTKNQAGSVQRVLGGSLRDAPVLKNHNQVGSEFTNPNEFTVGTGAVEGGSPIDGLGGIR